METTVSSRRIVVSCLAIISFATAVIHFAASGGHFREFWFYGVFLLVVAWLQMLWAIAASSLENNSECQPTEPGNGQL